jgi:hypothetical protein
MNEQLTPAMQRRIQVLQHYMRAMESGDVDAIAAVLNEAEQDRALERMILEFNEVYQHEDHTLVSPADVALVQQHLTAILAVKAAATEEAPVQSLDSKDSPDYTLSPPPYVALDNAPEPEGEGVHNITHQQVHKALPARKAPIQVLPARQMTPQKWYRTRRNWVVAAVAAVLIALLLLPNSGALASQMLSFFRVQNFQPVQVTKQDVQTLSSRPIPSLEDLGTVHIQPGSLQTHDNLVETQAAQMVSFPILLPHYLPRGISGTPDFGVIDGGHGTFTFGASKAHAFFVKNGYGNVNIPANLDGATFDLTTTAGVVIAYGNQADTQFMVVEVPSPAVRATGKASLDELRNVVLSLPGLPPQLVAQLRQINLSSGIVPLPIPSGIDSQSVTVHGTTGLLLTSNISTTIEQIKKFPAGSAVVWQMHGIIYALGGTVSDTNQLLTSANSLR